MRKYLFGAAMFLMLATACNKKYKDYHRATIIDAGDVTLDGCGYLLRFDDGKEEKPVYLPSNYQHNDMKVIVKYHSSGIYDTCGFTAPRSFYELVYIDEIEKDLN